MKNSAIAASPIDSPVSRLEQDAARYRWLRDTNLTRPDMTDGSRVILAPNEVISIWHGLPEEQWDLMGGCLRCSRGAEFDSAIDAAMKSANAGGKPQSVAKSD